jgi:hypothetical protein
MGRCLVGFYETLRETLKRFVVGDGADADGTGRKVRKHAEAHLRNMVQYLPAISIFSTWFRFSRSWPENL